MKAHIGNYEYDVEKNHMTLRDGEACGVLYCDIDGIVGIIRFKADVDLICDENSREFDLKSVAVSKAEFNIKHEADANKARIEQERLNNIVSEHITTSINDNQEYLLDNQHDFNIEVRNTFERMEFQNIGVGGHTYLAKDPQKQEQLENEGDGSAIDGYNVEFDVDYTLEFYDESKEELVMKDFVVNDIIVTDWIDNKDVVVVLTEEEKEVMGKRVIAAIQDNYSDAEYYMCEALGGNPIE